MPAGAARHLLGFRLYLGPAALAIDDHAALPQGFGEKVRTRIQVR
jgi:hypothetical protein